MKIKADKIPFAYLITFRTYGTWLFGNPKKSVHHDDNQFCTPKIGRNEILHQQMQNSLKQKIITLNSEQRDIVLSGIIAACQQYQWRLFAAHVRSNHVHLILKTSVTPEFAMRQLKAFATRFLRDKKLHEKDLKLWVRHGSTQYIWKPDFLPQSMKYVLDEQGERMSCFYEKWYDDKNSLIIQI